MVKIATCELCNTIIDYKKDPKHVCDYIECASCQKVLELNSEDMTNTRCNYCGGELK